MTSKFSYTDEEYSTISEKCERLNLPSKPPVGCYSIIRKIRREGVSETVLLRLSERDKILRNDDNVFKSDIEEELYSSGINEEENVKTQKLDEDRSDTSSSHSSGAVSVICVQKPQDPNNLSTTSVLLVEDMAINTSDTLMWLNENKDRQMCDKYTSTLHIPENQSSEILIETEEDMSESVGFEATKLVQTDSVDDIQFKDEVTQTEDDFVVYNDLPSQTNLFEKSYEQQSTLNLIDSISSKAIFNNTFPIDSNVMIDLECNKSTNTMATLDDVANRSVEIQVKFDNDRLQGNPDSFIENRSSREIFKRVVSYSVGVQVHLEDKNSSGKRCNKAVGVPEEVHKIICNDDIDNSISSCRGTRFLTKLVEVDNDFEGVQVQEETEKYRNKQTPRPGKVLSSCSNQGLYGHCGVKINSDLKYQRKIGKFSTNLGKIKEAHKGYVTTDKQTKLKSCFSFNNESTSYKNWDHLNTETTSLISSPPNNTSLSSNSSSDMGHFYTKTKAFPDQNRKSYSTVGSPRWYSSKNDGKIQLDKSYSMHSKSSSSLKQHHHGYKDDKWYNLSIDLKAKGEGKSKEETTDVMSYRQSEEKFPVLAAFKNFSEEMKPLKQSLQELRKKIYDLNLVEIPPPDLSHASDSVFAEDNKSISKINELRKNKSPLRCQSSSSRLFMTTPEVSSVSSLDSDFSDEENEFPLINVLRSVLEREERKRNRRQRKKESTRTNVHITKN